MFHCCILSFIMGSHSLGLRKDMNFPFFNMFYLPSTFSFKSRVSCLIPPPQSPHQSVQTIQYHLDHVFYFSTKELHGDGKMWLWVPQLALPLSQQLQWSLVLLALPLGGSLLVLLQHLCSQSFMDQQWLLEVYLQHCRVQGWLELVQLQVAS